MPIAITAAVARQWIIDHHDTIGNHCGQGSRWEGPESAAAMLEVRRGPRRTLEIGERAVVEGAFVSSPQDHAGRAARFQRFAPAGRTQAPAVSGPQAGKAEFGHRRRKIIAVLKTGLVLSSPTRRKRDIG